MAEVGLLPFARTALEVSTAVLSPYRSRFSKHQFTQPQLLDLAFNLYRLRYPWAPPGCQQSQLCTLSLRENLRGVVYGAVFV